MLAERKKTGPTVLYVVDADASVREALCRLTDAGGLRTRAFASIEQFLADLDSTEQGCLLLDATLVGDGCTIRDSMRRRRLDWPVIVICAGADQTARRRARTVEADFLLRKPVDDQALFDSIAWFTGEEW